MYFPGYCCPWKFIQIIDLIGGLPGSLNNEQANSALSHVSFKSEIQSIKHKNHFTVMFFSVRSKGKSSPEQRDKIFNAREVANMNCMVRAADQSFQISHLLALSHYIFICIMEILERQPSNNILPERLRDSYNVLKRGTHHNHNQSPDYLQLSALFITAGSQ